MAPSVKITVLNFLGSRYPSHRLWEDGTLIRDLAQGRFVVGKHKPDIVHLIVNTVHPGL